MSVIHYQKKEDMKFETAGNGILRAEMLPGMVDGVHTYKCKVAAGTVVTLETFGDQTQIYYFTRGEGYVATPKKAFNIEEPSLFIPNMDKEANILHAATDMEFLQLTSVMLPEDYEQFEHWHIALPRFCPLSGCIEYIEGFRPEGIKALSILDTHFLTRMTMGAIIGKGPNKAAPHSHDNLYQWYYGMPGTKFIYRAADEEIELHEGDWAFIPTDIEHAIEIEEDENVNYVWFESIFHIGKLLVQGIVTSFGTTAIAANAVALTISEFTHMPGFAIGLSLITVVGRCAGAGDLEQARYYVKKITRLSFLVTGAVAALSWIFAGPVVGFYQMNHATWVLAVEIVRWQALACLFVWVPAFNISDALRAASDVKFTMAVSMISMWIFRVGCSFLFRSLLDVGVICVWFAMFLDWMFRAGVFTLRFRGTKWEGRMFL